MASNFTPYLTKEDMVKYIQAKSKIVIENLMKASMFPKSPQYQSWKREAHSVFSEMKLKSISGMMPSSRFIYNNGWVYYKKKFNEMLYDCYDEVVRRYGEYMMMYEMKNWESHKSVIFFSIDNYFKWISHRLHKNRFIQSDEAMSQMAQVGI